MTDSEVGELWAKAKLPVVIDLIRKLVEERAQRKMEQAAAVPEYYPQCLADALADFGIDPATWRGQK